MRIIAALFFVLASLIRAGAAVPAFDVTFPEHDSQPLMPLSINNGGDIVGTNAVTHNTFLLSKGIYSEFPDLLVTRINDEGTICGRTRSNLPRGIPSRAMLRFSDGEVVLPEFGGEYLASMNGFNTSGDGLGVYLEGGSTPRPVMMPHDADPYIYHVSGEYSSMLLDINDVGQIVGSTSGDSGSYTFILLNGVMNTLPSIAGGPMTARDINNSGQVAGYFFDGTGRHGCIYDGAGYTVVDLEGLPGVALQGLNDRGQLIGSYLTPTGGSRGFIATPRAEVPEPGSIPLMLSALPAALSLRKRHRTKSCCKS